MCIRDRSVSAYVSSLRQSNRPLPLVAAAILIAVCAVWGLNMVSIKISNPGLPPLHAVALRNSVAALVIGVWFMEWQLGSCSGSISCSCIGVLSSPMLLGQ